MISRLKNNVVGNHVDKGNNYTAKVIAIVSFVESDKR